jgi:hypothetical protein
LCPLRLMSLVSRIGNTFPASLSDVAFCTQDRSFSSENFSFSGRRQNPVPHCALPSRSTPCPPPGLFPELLRRLCKPIVQSPVAKTDPAELCGYCFYIVNILYIAILCLKFRPKGRGLGGGVQVLKTGRIRHPHGSPDCHKHPGADSCGPSLPRHAVTEYPWPRKTPRRSPALPASRSRSRRRP